jgi:hypothetical protein
VRLIPPGRGAGAAPDRSRAERGTGAGFAATLGGGALAGLIADQIVEAWWLRRERQRDVANGYVGKR